jgi:leader peptidase (prepilin peptidase)/N-methyltransferase
MALTIIYLFVLGLLIGSFLNVVILRYNTGKSLSGRSGCFSCRHALGWYELVPVLSFLVLSGRCRHCGSKISRQYIGVELSTGILFALSAWRFYPDISASVFACLLSAVLVVIVAYDLKHQIIPDLPAYLFIVLAILSPIFFRLDAGLTTGLGTMVLKGLGAGLLYFLIFASIWYFSGGHWMGFGDAKLAFGIGALLGFFGGFNALVLAFWTGALVGLALIGLSRLKLARRYSIKSEVPFAPFLALGLVIYLFFGLTVMRW